MKTFSANQRSEIIEQLQSEIFDLVIIGGGINGAGIARDAASRGMKVALVEASDFTSGTSSRSSKLVHGGIRYLENMEFGLVFEALNERTKLFELAPHLVHPLRFMIPLYDSSRVGMFKMGLGMWLYDALSLFQAPEFHERLNAADSVERMPILKPSGLKGSYVYSDAYMDDDRLVIETLRAAHEDSAVSINYTKAIEVKYSKENKFESLVVKDQLSNQTFQVQGRHMIGSVGPWTDEMGFELFSDWKKHLRTTKGIHLTLTKDRLPLSSAVVMAAEKSDRIVFGIPRHEMVIIGTTDTDFKGSPGEVGATSEDVKYLIDIVNSYFPGANLTEADIVSSYAGVRPLIYDGAQTEGKTSREHSIWQDPRGLTFVAGGKYTTYRLMSEQVVEKALNDFSVADRVRFANSKTNQPLNAHVESQRYHDIKNQVLQIAERFSFPVDETRWLVERYGAEALLIFERTSHLTSVWEKEAHQAIHFTMCDRILDFMTRRVPLFLSLPDHGVSELESISRVFASELKLSETQRKQQIQTYLDYIKKELHWKSA
jgi:glycerol-3-phosphate dehydrogenase